SAVGAALASPELTGSDPPPPPHAASKVNAIGSVSTQRRAIQMRDFGHPSGLLFLIAWLLRVVASQRVKMSSLTNAWDEARRLGGGFAGPSHRDPS
ncbi:MAG: hypothetical protein J4F97_03455, partial [Pseudomonadales bacterium]|nr:hypothetical protein [Pseudomonadales bacterium]